MIGAPLLLSALAVGATMPQERAAGFSAERALDHMEHEAAVLAIPSPDSARRHMEIITAEPHVAGTPEGRRVAGFLLEQLRSYGFEAELHEYHVYLQYPDRVSAELVAPERVALEMNEPPVEGDVYSESPKVLQGWNAFTRGGSVNADVVYVNYGLPEDYEALAERGIDPGGKVVLARYGRSFRGVKARVAEENGAAGLLIYSDPEDDGYLRGDTYPDGPWRPASAIQRGSVQYLFLYPGDPLTPGRASVEAAARLRPDSAADLAGLPVAPLSYGEARKVLERLDGPVVPESWQGGLPFPYHVGPGPARVRLTVELDGGVRAIWNVIGRLSGSESAERLVILGNHHDAWTFGATDPGSGTTAMLEAARALGRLYGSGWRPRRTIVFAFWDAEEYGLIGSTEWVEEHRDALRENAIAYFNVDAFVAGPPDMEGVPSLTDLVRSVTDRVTDPGSGRPLGRIWHDSAYARWQGEHSGVPLDRRPPFRVEMGPLGSGSDYTAFLDHAGVPAVDIDLSGPYGVYHSAYDNFAWYARFGDPEWRYIPMVGQVLALLALRTADADVLPFRHSDYGRKLGDYLEELETANLDEEGRPRFDLDMSRARGLADEIARVAAGLEQEIEARLAADALDPDVAARLDEALIRFERDLTDPRGLPRRPWFKHLIYAPGFDTGYAALPLPGAAQALRDGDGARLSAEMTRLEQAFRRALTTLEGAAATIREAAVPGTGGRP